MTRSTKTHPTENNRTEFFTVVGSPYVSERHADVRNYYRTRENGEKAPGGVAGLWLVFYAVIAIAGVTSLLGSSRTFEIAAAFLK
jgi:hypothetical protein